MNSDEATVNPHYLDHVVAVAQTQQVEASEDILSGSGVKLLARGARVDAAVRDLSLEHKLRKPLEECVQVVGGVSGEGIAHAGQALLARRPVLRAMCTSERAEAPPATLASLRLSGPMRSLLSVYARYQEDRLDHAVGVAMMALGLGAPPPAGRNGAPAHAGSRWAAARHR